MAIVTGQGATLQIGQESTWGTAAEPDTLVNFLNESLNLNIERTEEDTLVGGVTSKNMDIMRKSVSGDFALIAKPGNVGKIIGLSLGVEAEPETAGGVTTHTFTPIHAGLNNSLPSFTTVINRHVATKAYTGCKVNSLAIAVSAGDYMRLTVSTVGKNEETGTSAEGLTIPELKAFRFAGGTCTFDGVEFGEVTGVTVNYGNNLDEGVQTLGSGYFNTEAEPQSRDITVSIESFYNANTETVREQKYKTENNCAVVLRFESPDVIEGDTHYSVEITLPKVVINECNPNIAGKERINLTIGGKALQPESGEAITIKLVDATATKYIA